MVLNVLWKSLQKYILLNWDRQIGFVTTANLCKSNFIFFLNPALLHIYTIKGPFMQNFLILGRIFCEI
jgi:hypothetical protein